MRLLKNIVNLPNAATRELGLQKVRSAYEEAPTFEGAAVASRILNPGPRGYTRCQPAYLVRELA